MLTARRAPGVPSRDALLVGLQAANAPALPAGLDLDLLPDAQGAVLQGSGDDRAEAGDSEDAVDGQARTADVAQLVAAAVLIQRGIERGEDARTARRR